ncbi:NADPH-dependent FMN reductase [Mangrovimonas xylaniphaga]|uniref:NADPH-dependent FMN reductase n=1 Tax=Mangrovimonas xylaniphaga TaxID=1645915 RepID=UPI0006B60352|nr:NAD(P)H-dependent oxidoreductase [Mangrovimonas xylaniphaga]
MKHIVGFAGSNSKTSINKQLVKYTLEQMEDVTAELLDLNDFTVPLFGVDLEKEQGYPDKAKLFLEKMQSADGLVISLAEHNAAYTAAFKNLFDWMSRIDRNVFNEKHMLLMATSPGGRGGASVLGMASERFPRHGANIVAKFSLPSFNDNFSEGSIVNKDLDEQLKVEVAKLKEALK